MPANNALLLSDINFDDIKSNLQTFLSNQTEIGDYDYESSTMQVLLNLLAYNTYMNSYYLNMVGNEMFLDSAQIRSNIISRAKMLNYTPRSAQGSQATVQVVVTPTDTPATITVDRNTKFRTTVDGKQYIFVNHDAKVINADSNGVYSTNIQLTEGRPFNFSYTVSAANPVRYVIPADNVDVRSLIVTVQNSATDSTLTTFNEADTLTDVTSTTPAYFLQENEDGRYELLFGDGNLGKQLNNGNIVNIEYRVCNGVATNGANTFSSVDNISGYSDITVNFVSRAQGGGDKESLQSIKFNAPKNYEAQNRAVTRKDYENIVKGQFSDIQAVSVWGGEDNTPAIYGKVYLAVKPYTGTILAEDRKQTIKDYIARKNVLTIEPEIVDPTYLYVKPELTVKYNPDLTNLTPTQMSSVIADEIINYETNRLGLFGQDFISSQLIKDVYSKSEAINSIQIELHIEKKFVPNTTIPTTYTIAFNNEIHNYENVIKAYNVSSSKFTYNSNNNCYFDDDGAGNLRIYTLGAEGVRTYLNNNVGTVDYLTGIITINSLLITAYSGDSITLTIDPDKDDITALRNQLMLIKDASVSLYDTKLKATVSTVASINTEGTTSTIPETGVTTTVY
jgi:hypothetical protein